MIEQRTLDLIHAELDGELHVGDLAELQRRLEADRLQFTGRIAP